MNWWQKYRFTFNFLAIAVLLEVLWFFVTWLLIEKYDLAGFLMTLALPAAGAVYLLLPAEKRERCTAADLKILNLISRIALGITALFAAFVLSGMHLHLPTALLNEPLWYALWLQFALHVFAIITFTGLAVLPPKGYRKKPALLLLAIYLVSTFMQIMVFPAVVKVYA
jgi:hypothetical protein